MEIMDSRIIQELLNYSGLIFYSNSGTDRSSGFEAKRQVSKYVIASITVITVITVDFFRK